ncbi:MAG: hypothetical protein E6Q40_06650 [Cupriavidus sp.]|nr:MAG: hypothetical protein E6Q40_06650 [Cupriavidus sp.]
MDPLAATIEIFVSSVTVAVFGGMALLAILESRTPRRAVTVPKATPNALISTTADEIQLGAVQTAKAGNSDSIAAKAA